MFKPFKRNVFGSKLLNDWCVGRCGLSSNYFDQVLLLLLLLLLGHIKAIAIDIGLLIPTASLSLSVCLLVTFVSPAKTAVPVEMPFGGRYSVDPAAIY